MGDDELLKFVESLFTTGFGDKAARLMLVDANNKDLGGWGREAIIQRIRDYTRTPTAEVENLRAKANGEPSPEFPNLIIIDTPEGREAFARECFEAGLHNRTHYLDNFRQYFMRYSDTYQTADDFIEKLREENKL